MDGERSAMQDDTTLTEAHHHTMFLEQRLRQRFGRCTELT